MLDDSSTYNLFTSRPSGPVCGVISFFLKIFLDASANSSILFKIFTPPALPLPLHVFGLLKQIFQFLMI
ncbi:MAG: hypothetical protein CM1200mP5_6410 [Candidatus Pelagibacterales bacterium]|nr:MAG: hypothetical protein CM1200mP5_6410 [Pelagibacterales bacterium]